MGESYIYRDGEIVSRKSGERIATTGTISRPFVMRDIPAYASPINGQIIGSRSERREDLKRNNCVEAEPSMFPKRDMKTKKFQKFAENSR